jgi:calmodulin-binding transcription activator
VRAHQERKKYKELIRSVGVLEKVMLRWYRKGVGLRGFNSGAMPVDEEVEEDVAKVFRKLRVETAIDEAVSRVSCIIGSPKAMQQYRRMLQRYQQAKVNIPKDASEVPTSKGEFLVTSLKSTNGVPLQTCMRSSVKRFLN